jgi:hypothetical protein
MAKTSSLPPEGARRRAEERFARVKQRDEEARTAYAEREKLQQAENAKTDRLRALRLAKEAADADAAGRAAAAKTAAAQAAAERKASARSKPAKSKPELV